MSSSVFTSPHQNWLDNSGKPLAGGRLYAYDAGTTTPTTTWQDAAHTQVNTNPVILDSGGFTTVWLDPTKSYRFRMDNALGVQMWTVDNYQAASLTANILVPLDYLLPAQGTNSINNGSFDQNWNWSLTGSNAVAGFAISENAPSTNTNPLSVLAAVATRTGSTVRPFSVSAWDGAGGLTVAVNGDIQAVGSATYIGPVRLPAWPNQGVLGTDALGNIIPGTGGGGGGIGANFVDDEVVAGSGLSFTLAIAPNPPASLLLFQFLTGFGSVLLRPNVEYTLADTAITTANPVPAGNLTAWYRTSGGGVTPPPPTPSPSITSMSPSSGSANGGTTVTITGTNFSSPATVTFGGIPAASSSVVSSTTIVATTPAGTGAVTVVVTIGGQSASPPTAFTYLAGPTVTGISPSSGAANGGTSVTITGTNFAVGATVTIGGAPATFVVVVSATSITAITPPGAAGTATVSVTSNSQTNSLLNAYTYIAQPNQPTVTSVSPNSGAANAATLVTVYGTNFTLGFSVTFGGVPATSLYLVDAGTITCTTPILPGGAVAVAVTVSGLTGTLNNAYTYIAPIYSGVGAPLQVGATSVATSANIVTVEGVLNTHGPSPILITCDAMPFVLGQTVLCENLTTATWLNGYEAIIRLITGNTLNSEAGSWLSSPNIPAFPYGPAPDTGTVSIPQAGGNTVTLNTGDVLAQVQTTPETVNQIFSFATLNLNGQYIYLLLTLSTHTVFWDQGNNPFPMNAPIAVTVGGMTMYLYRSQNQMYGTTWTIQLRN